LLTKHGKLLTAKGIYDAPISSEPKKPCVPRRKYGLGFLHQNIEAIAQYEKAQKEFQNNCKIKVTNSNQDNLQLLLEAAALTAFDANETG